MAIQIRQVSINASGCTYCSTHKTTRCALCKDLVCATHRVKVQGYTPAGTVDMCQPCAKYIDTIVAPKYSQ